MLIENACANKSVTVMAELIANGLLQTMKQIVQSVQIFDHWDAIATRKKTSRACGMEKEMINTRVIPNAVRKKYFKSEVYVTMLELKHAKYGKN